jgi:ABC-type sugar transport system permease subunit
MMLRFLCLAVIDACSLWFLYRTLADGVWFLAAVIGLITLGINVIFLNERLYPFRWLSPSMALMLLMVIYPLFFTIYTAFTNYSDTHLLTKQQAIKVIEKERFLPSGASTYRWAAYRSPDGDFALALKDDGSDILLAFPGQKPSGVAKSSLDIGPLDADGFPANISDFARLNKAETVRLIDEIAKIEFGLAPETYIVHSLAEAAQYQQRYVYDAMHDRIVDQEDGKIFAAAEGAFISSDGMALRPGFQVLIGFANFKRLLNSPALQGPLIRVFLWTVAFSALSVLMSFALGLFLALVFNDPAIPGRKLIRSCLLIPYAVPFFISILIWRGMLNPHVGIISKVLEFFLNWSPPWLSDPWWTKISVLIVNLWLGFPYMMLITTGALQAIPSELFEAAEVDGASTWQRFWHITLPLLLISVGPLLIFSFAFNFNNFNVIYLFNRGGPPMPNTPTPVGHTDILISYSFRLAFEGGRGGDYGYASSITIIIFIILAIITLFQFRYARMLEEVSENV